MGEEDGGEGLGEDAGEGRAPGGLGRLAVVEGRGIGLEEGGAGAEAVAIGDGFFRRIALFYLIFGRANGVRGYLEGRGDVL